MFRILPRWCCPVYHRRSASLRFRTRTDRSRHKRQQFNKLLTKWRRRRRLRYKFLHVLPKSFMGPPHLNYNGSLRSMQIGRSQRLSRLKPLWCVQIHRRRWSCRNRSWRRGYFPTINDCQVIFNHGDTRLKTRQDRRQFRVCLGSNRTAQDGFPACHRRLDRRRNRNQMLRKLTSLD